MVTVKSALDPDVVATLVGNDPDGPLIIQPANSQAATLEWISKSKALIDQEILKRGALFFRGFSITNPDSLLAFAKATSKDSPNFKEESSPRSQVKGAVYTSTDYPSDYAIQFHNEYSYANEWPMKLYFACLTPPTSGGETPIASSRNLLKRLKPATVEEFRKKGIQYVRNFQPGLGVTWQTAFQTSDRAEVEEYCQIQGLSFEWLPKDVFRTRKNQAAIVRHPVSGDEVWFNHAYFWNAHSLEPEEVREYMLSLPPETLPTNTFYGDGSPIPEVVIQEIQAAYEQESIKVPWERGDVLLLDNMLMSHSRSSFTGQRQIIVQMSDGFRRSHLK